MRSQLILSLVSLHIIACSQAAKTTEETTTTPAQTAPMTAVAELESKSGSKVTGQVQFAETEEGLTVTFNIKGLKKNSLHGFHVHEVGDCSAPDAKSAGPHYMQMEPTGGTAKNSPGRHAGDLPMLKSDKDGNAVGTFTVKDLSINKHHPIADRAIIVHGGPDDPKKDSPPRIACGVIKVSGT